MPTKRKLRVFLCHASQDKPTVRKLYQRLKAEGWIDPWLDEEKLLPGQDWGLEIEKAVEKSDVVIVCLSSRSVNKEGFIQKEIKKVLDISDQKPEATIFIIPIRLEDCDPPRHMGKWQYVDFFPSERTDWAYARVLDSLKFRAEKNGIVSSREKDEPEVIPLRDRLSDLEFEVLTLVAEGLSPQEIAQRLKRPVKDIKSTTKAIRKNLNSRTIPQVSRLIHLTRRELQVLYLFNTGISLREIASKLGISLSTVSSHTYSVREKLGVKSTLEALNIVKKHKLF